MRLEDLDVETMRRAVGIYLQHAFEKQQDRKGPPIDWKACRRAEDVLASFKDDTGNQRMRRYSLRLGNSHYPFMKLVFQELLIRDSFFFSVDTHDDLDIRSSYQDYEKWLELKRTNSRLKEGIEHAWEAAQVPTFASIVREVEEQTPHIGSKGKHLPEILVVDNEPDIARGVVTILERSGYVTRTASSGEEALERIEEQRPDLVLSDLEMDGMTGIELAERLRATPETAEIPFILATAATVGSSNFRVIDGYLVKPFDAKILLKFVEQHLESGKTG